MKKFLLVVLGTTGFINIASSTSSANYHDYLGVHIANKTGAPIYLFLERNTNSSACANGFNKEVAIVQPGLKYKFWIAHKKYRSTRNCYFRLLGFIDVANINGGKVILDERFSVKQLQNPANGMRSNHVASHDSPPSKCGLGMTCSAHSRNDDMSLYVTVSNKDNQYAQVKFYNNRPEVSYVKFERIKGHCSSNVNTKKWHDVLPKYEITDYIRNTHKGKICTYRVSIQDKNKQMLCNTELQINNDLQHNSVIESAFGNCRAVINNNNWSANISVN